MSILFFFATLYTSYAAVLLSLILVSLHRSGQPGWSEPKSYYLDGKSKDMISASDITLTDATIDFLNGQTIMEFTAPFKDLGVEDPLGENPMGISLHGSSLLIWAHGADGENTLQHHGPNNKKTYTVVNLASNSEAEQAKMMTLNGTITKSKSAWLAHGIMAFLAWGIAAPLAIAAAVLRDVDGTVFWDTVQSVSSRMFRRFGKDTSINQPSAPLRKRFNELLSKWWFYIHVGSNTINYFFTVIVFSVAVATIKKEGSPKWYHAHSKMGLTLFLLATFQLAGGYLRPSKELIAPPTNAAENETDDDEPSMTGSMAMKSQIRQAWELAHNVLGLALFLFGVWQMYEGIELYHMRYGNSSFIGVVIFYCMWMGSWTALIVGASVYKWMYQNGVSTSGVEDEVKETEVPEIKDAAQSKENAEESVNGTPGEMI